MLLTRGRRIARRLHSNGYVSDVLDLSKQSEEGKLHHLSDNETLVNRFSYDVASFALAYINGVTQNIIKDEMDDIFLAVRPPGHHAYFDRSSGFCIFNNAALAAYVAIKNNLRTLIFDFDAHHGDGTQDFVMKNFNAGRLHNEDETVDPNMVRFFSTFQDDIQFANPGQSYNEGNISFRSVPSGVDDAGYIELLKQYLIPMVEEFDPQFVVFSAGFDTCVYDAEDRFVKEVGLGVNMRLTGKSYEFIRDMFDGIKSLYLLEGGYNPKSIKEGIDALTD
jgi:acetoin utilization deacetylase AcuC-like enzyme